VCGLTALISVAAAEMGSGVSYSQPRQTTFEALGLNHLALRVTDLDRSQAFYEQHLGMTVIPSGDRSALRLMACGPHVLNLFKAEQARMDHVCFTIPDYDPKVAITRLRAKNIEPDVEEDRTHFLDPDGYKIQVGGPTAGGQQIKSRPTPRR
jgi:catechol 2,3-dioxygenase-like lactoylglutathione lyase family enzyme